MATQVLNWFFGAVRQPAQITDEPARSESTSVSIDARISVYPIGNDHPLARIFGKYAGDPMWIELEEIIERNQAAEESTDDV